MYLFLMNLLKPLDIPRPQNLEILWSLAVEEQFYLFWPFVIFFLSEKAVARVAVTLVIVAPLFRFFCTPYFHYFDWIYTLTPFRMDLLATGAIFALLWRHRRPLIERWGAYGPILTAAALAALLLLSRNPSFNTTANTRFGNLWIYELTLLASAGIVLWALSGRFVSILKLAPVRYIGRISYSFYLIHTTIIYLLQTYMRNTLAVAALSLTLALLYSAISWRFLEKPILYARSHSRVRKEAVADEQAIAS